MQFIRRSPFKLLNFIICGGGLLGFSILAIYPSYQNLARLDRQIAETNRKIEEQKILFPLFVDLLKKSKTKEPEKLPLTGPQPLNQQEVNAISQVFQSMAERNGLVLNEATPDVNSMVAGTPRLRLNLQVKGPFPGLRDFFVDIGKLPSLERVENLMIRTLPDTTDLELNARIGLTKG